MYRSPTQTIHGDKIISTVYQIRPYQQFLARRRCVRKKALGFVYIWNGSESESNIASRCVHSDSNLMFILNSDKDQWEKMLSCSLSFSVNEPLHSEVP